jgi:hypothetical protein
MYVLALISVVWPGKPYISDGVNGNVIISYGVGWMGKYRSIFSIFSLDGVVEEFIGQLSWPELHKTTQWFTIGHL